MSFENKLTTLLTSITVRTRWLINKIDGYVFGLRLKFLIIKHGGVDRVPNAALKRLMGPLPVETVIALVVFDYAKELEAVVYGDMDNWRLMKDLMCAIKSELHDVTALQRIDSIFTAENPLKAFTAALIETRDLSGYLAENHKHAINVLILEKSKQLPTRFNA